MTKKQVPQNELKWAVPIISKEAKLSAKVILEAAKLYEYSFDSEAADHALNEAQKEGKIIDINDFYGRDLHLSCRLACERYKIDVAFGYLVYLLLRHCWNDTLGWAESTIKQSEGGER